MRVIDLCADPLCPNEAEFTMISRVPGHRTKMCAEHRDRVLAAATKAGFSEEKLALLDIQAMDVDAFADTQPPERA
jgi:hypothetical protein